MALVLRNIVIQYDALYEVGEGSKFPTFNKPKSLVLLNQSHRKQWNPFADAFAAPHAVYAVRHLPVGGEGHWPQADGRPETV